MKKETGKRVCKRAFVVSLCAIVCVVVTGVIGLFQSREIRTVAAASTRVEDLGSLAGLIGPDQNGYVGEGIGCWNWSQWNRTLFDVIWVEYWEVDPVEHGAQEPAWPFSRPLQHWTNLDEHFRTEGSTRGLISGAGLPWRWLVVHEVGPGITVPVGTTERDGSPAHGIDVLLLAGDLLAWGCLSWLILFCPRTLVRIVRKKRMQCVSCGYQLVGGQRSCPECGDRL